MSLYSINVLQLEINLYDTKPFPSKQTLMPIHGHPPLKPRPDHLHKRRIPNHNGRLTLHPGKGNHHFFIRQPLQ